MARQPFIALLPFFLVLGAAGPSAVRAAGADAAEVVVKPMGTATYIDGGQIVSGWNSDTKQDFDMQFLTRTSVWLIQEGTIKERLDVKMGVGGVFWYSLPEQGGAAHTRLIRFGPGIRQAQLTYHVGRPDKPWLDIQAGLFPFKYNPDATNLGEYLLRSGTYPGFLVGGSWNIVNSAAYLAQGINFGFHLWDGRANLNFLLPMERDNPPMHSISPTLVGDVKPFPALELGAGVTWNHGISVKPSKEAPTNSVPGLGRMNSYVLGVSGDSVIRDTTKFYTFQGIKLMGRVTLDPKAFFEGGPFNPPDLKVFAEAAVLGVKDYPFYYENIMHRIPVMFGMHLPTFRLLDLLTVQAEFYDKQFRNNIDGVYESQWPIWYLDNYDPLARDDSATVAQVKDERWNWSVLARKDIAKGVRVWLQVANDHMRAFDYNIKPFKEPVTIRPKDWYYLFRLEFGL